MADITEKDKLLCQTLLKFNFNQRKAYQELHPKASNETADVNCSKILRKAKVQEYLTELTTKQEEKNLVSVEEVINGIKGDLARARESNQYSAVKGMWELLGKNIAMWTDKVQHGGEVRNVMTFEEAVKKESGNK
jgi:phage terminase small subunit